MIHVVSDFWFCGSLGLLQYFNQIMSALDTRSDVFGPEMLLGILDVDSGYVRSLERVRLSHI